MVLKVEGQVPLQLHLQDESPCSTSTAEKDSEFACLVESAHRQLAVQNGMSILLAEALLDYDRFAQKAPFPHSLQRQRTSAKATREILWAGRIVGLTASAPWLRSSKSAVPIRGSTSSGMTATSQLVQNQLLQNVAGFADLRTRTTQVSSLAQARMRFCAGVVVAKGGQA